MTEKLKGMSALIETAMSQENDAVEELPEKLSRPSEAELEVARELVRSARERGAALTGPGGGC